LNSKSIANTKAISTLTKGPAMDIINSCLGFLGILDNYIFRSNYASHSDSNYATGNTKIIKYLSLQQI